MVRCGQSGREGGIRGRYPDERHEKHSGSKSRAFRDRDEFGCHGGRGLIGVQESEFYRPAVDLVDARSRARARVAAVYDHVVGSGAQMIDTERARRHVAVNGALDEGIGSHAVRGRIGRVRKRDVEVVEIARIEVRVRAELDGVESGSDDRDRGSGSVTAVAYDLVGGNR